MKRSPTVFKAGTRPSSLALTQTRAALDRIEGMLNGVAFEMMPITSIGDGDRSTDLRDSPADFFTRELDTALLRGDVDFAVHSAKDLPSPMPSGIDWFWLPWREEPRDVLILGKGKTIADLPDNPVIGVSSDRREEYSSKRFPGAIQKPIRGNIEERIAQVDDGTYDIVIMAAAALFRLGIEERITEWIPIDELEVPEGQGYLAVTLREGDEKMRALRNLFIKAVTFAGIYNTEHCSGTTVRALHQCDVCLCQPNTDKALLAELPLNSLKIDTGKYSDIHGGAEHSISETILEYVRRGKKVVYLANGNSFSSDHLEAQTSKLKQLEMPFNVISAESIRPTETGELLSSSEAINTLTEDCVGEELCSLKPD